MAIRRSNFKHCIFCADNFVTHPSKRQNIIQSQTQISEFAPTKCTFLLQVQRKLFFGNPCESSFHYNALVTLFLLQKNINFISRESGVFFLKKNLSSESKHYWTKNDTSDKGTHWRCQKDSKKETMTESFVQLIGYLGGDQQEAMIFH